MRLVVIEDDANFAYLLGESLRGLTDTVSVFSNWDDAFKEFSESEHDIAWVDLRMPTSSESETISRLAHLRKENEKIVIIVGSGYVTPTIRADLDRVGVDGVFYKSGEYRATQVASLIILGIMKSHKKFNDREALLNRALRWMDERFHKTPIDDQPEAA